MLPNVFRSIASRGATALLAVAASTAAAENAELLAGVSVPFIENRGARPEEVAFYTRVLGGGLFVTYGGSLVYDLRSRRGDGGAVLTEKPEGGRISRIEGDEPVSFRVGEFRGSDPSRWERGAPAYRKLDMGERFDGVRITLRAGGGNVEKRFHVAPGADPAGIRMRVEGADRLWIDEGGRLVCETARGPVLFTAPAAFQEQDGVRVSVAVAYRAAEGDLSYGFRVGPYDESRELVIDPLLASTFLGGTSDEGDWSCNAVAEDASGNLYVAARVQSMDFPFTSGAYDTISGPGTDIFIVKMSGDMTSLLAATFLGGSSSEGTGQGDCLALDGDCNVYVAGFTMSNDFPVTPGARDTTYAANGDVFVSKFDPDLTTLLASTYFGKRQYESANTVLVDDQGRVFVAGRTKSDNLPTTPGCYDSTWNGQGPVSWGGDLFITRFDSDLTVLEASTYLGSAGWEQGGYMALDGEGNPVIAGSTGGSDFPTTGGVYDETYNGGVLAGGDVFVARMDSDLTTLLASTFLGGSANDFGHAVTLDDSGRVYVTGETGEASTSDFPTTPGAYDETYNTWGGNNRNDVFLSRLSPDLSTLQASTFLGGGGLEIGLSVRVNSEGDLFVSGSTVSYDFPTAPCAYDPGYNGGSQDYGGDLFVSRLDGDLTELRASTFLGGSGEESSGRMILDGDENPVVVGQTPSANFPCAPGAWAANHSGGFGDDVVLVRLDAGLSEAGTAVEEGAPPPVGAALTIRPNPFNPSTTVSFEMKKAGRVAADIFDSAGRFVAHLVEGTFDPGPVRIAWDGAGRNGEPLPSGVYLCRLRAGGEILCAKMILLR
ncbi:MAG: SBBP repeat-containing protein [Candidatus Eisenbacteria bacterium]|nr:SBBP repeat-containing protein [Candidatus Eisenbacteria bacterium]